VTGGVDDGQVRERLASWPSTGSSERSSKVCGALVSRLGVDLAGGVQDLFENVLPETKPGLAKRFE
jgi:hypothetical protein